MNETTSDKKKEIGKQQSRRKALFLFIIIAVTWIQFLKPILDSSSRMFLVDNVTSFKTNITMLSKNGTSNISLSNNSTTKFHASTSSNATVLRSNTAFLWHNDSTTTTTNDVNVYIQMAFPRKDRLGCHMKRPLFLMAYAHCHNVQFCIGRRRGFAHYFAEFDTCPRGLTNVEVNWNELLKNDVPLNTSTPNVVYVYKKRGNDDRLLEQWRDRHMDCAFDEDVRQKWGKMIVQASKQISNQTQNLFENKTKNVVTIAMHIRRGDYSSWGRTLIPDEPCVVLLRRLRHIFEAAGKTPQVHLFSEDYGVVHVKQKISLQWNLYQDVVDFVHFAPDLRQFGVKGGRHLLDIGLNLRDWRHFVQADVLIVGSPFSGVPALGRARLAPSSTTGLPLTLDLWGSFGSGSPTYYQYAWLEYPNGCVYPNVLELHHLPKVWAQYDTIPSSFQEFNMSQWNDNKKKCSHKAPPVCPNQTSTRHPYIRKCV